MDSFLNHCCLSNDLRSKKLTTYSHTLTASVGVCKSCCIGKALIYLHGFYHCASIKHLLSHPRTIDPCHLRKCVFLGLKTQDWQEMQIARSRTQESNLHPSLRQASSLLSPQVLLAKDSVTFRRVLKCERFFVSAFISLRRRNFESEFFFNIVQLTL